MGTNVHHEINKETPKNRYFCGSWLVLLVISQSHWNISSAKWTLVYYWNVVWITAQTKVCLYTAPETENAVKRGNIHESVIWRDSTITSGRNIRSKSATTTIKPCWWNNVEEAELREDLLARKNNIESEVNTQTRR